MFLYRSRGLLRSVGLALVIASSCAPAPQATMPGYASAVFIFRGQVLGPPVLMQIGNDGLTVNNTVVVARKKVERLTRPGVYPSTDTWLRNAYREFDAALHLGGVVFFSPGKPLISIPPGRQAVLALKIVGRYRRGKDASDLEDQGMSDLVEFKEEIRQAALQDQR